MNKFCCWCFSWIIISTALADNQYPPLRLATTTSVENSGLLDHLLPDFESSCRCVVHVLAVGSGKAILLGKQGDIDVLITHSPEDEKKFLQDGYGINRQSVMYNSFVLLGPVTDKITAIKNNKIQNTLATIARLRYRFISRGDLSGTHRKELNLWSSVETLENEPIDFDPSWYISSGVGMGQAIIIADELRAYTLSDIGTYLFFREKVDLSVIVSEDPPLINPYSVIQINPKRHKDLNSEQAALFIKWITSKKIQNKIANYRLHNETLFFPGSPPNTDE